MKLIELLDQEAARLEQSGVFFGHGTLNAFDEAAWLLLWRLGLPLDDLDGVAEQKLTPTEVQQVRSLVDQRIQSRLPAAYLTQEAWLQGVPFYVDERSIVPRSLIAEPLAEGALDALLGREPTRVLDLCTGNGSLAILAAMAWPQAQVDASDLSAAALEVAQINRERHHLQARIQLLQGDGWAAVEGRRYELVLCNPPYVNADSMQALPAEYRAEPAMALAGGKDGMDFIRPLLRQAAQHLHEDAFLVLEIGNEAPHFVAAFPNLDVIWLNSSAGDDQVLAIDAASLRRHANIQASSA